MITSQIGWSNKEYLLYDILKQVNKLTNTISSFSTPSSYIFSNGINESLGNVKLGGPLNEPFTVISGSNTKSLEINSLDIFSLTTNTLDLTFNNTFTLSAVDDYLTIDNNGNISMPNTETFFVNSSGEIQLSQEDTGTGDLSYFDITYPNLVISSENAGNTIFGTVTVNQGNVLLSTRNGADEMLVTLSSTNFNYASDYSANYTNRSLTDKEYVDTAVSDIRLKTNINYIESALDKINLLKPATFNMIKDNEFKAGFIAQELQEVFPEMIVEGEYLKIKKDQLLPYLVKAIQELSEKIDKLSK